MSLGENIRACRCRAAENWNGWTMWFPNVDFSVSLVVLRLDTPFDGTYEKEGGSAAAAANDDDGGDGDLTAE